LPLATRCSRSFLFNNIFPSTFKYGRYDTHFEKYVLLAMLINRQENLSVWKGYAVESGSKPVEPDAMAQGARADLARWVGAGSGRNLLLGGLSVHQTRDARLPAEGTDVCGGRFGSLTTACAELRFLDATAQASGVAGDLQVQAWITELRDPMHPYGSDPVFESTNTLYIPSLANNEERFYNTSTGSDEVRAALTACFEGFLLVIGVPMVRESCIAVPFRGV
jgi:hypothetical protein